MGVENSENFGAGEDTCTKIFQISNTSKGGKTNPPCSEAPLKFRNPLKTCSSSRDERTCSSSRDERSSRDGRS